MKRFVLMFVLAFVFQCATTKTDRFVIDLPTLKPINQTLGFQLLRPNLRKMSVHQRKDDFFVTSLEKKELISLNHSLYSSLTQNKLFKAVRPIKSKHTRFDLRLFWFIRNYNVIASGSQATGAACVSYCLVDAENKIVLSEDFSVATDCFRCLLGSVKTKINSAIVNRMIVRLYNVHQGAGDPKLLLPITYNEVTYHRTYREALKVFPETLRDRELAKAEKYDSRFWRLLLSNSKKVNWNLFVNKRLATND